MATALEHMQADFAADLEANGVTVSLDGGNPTVFVHGMEITPSEFERTVIERKKVTHQIGDVAEKVPGQVVMLDGSRWEVVTHDTGKIAGTLVLQRSVG